MPSPLPRQRTRSHRTVVSLSMPIDPDWKRATRAAGILHETLADFMREAIRQRANRVLGKHDEKVAALDVAA